MVKRKIGRLSQNDIRAAPGIGMSWSQPTAEDEAPVEERIPLYPMADPPKKPSHKAHLNLHDYDLLEMPNEDEEHDPTWWTRGSATKVWIQVLYQLCKGL